MQRSAGAAWAMRSTMRAETPRNASASDSSAAAQRHGGAAATGSAGSSTMATGRGTAPGRPVEAVAPRAAVLKNWRRLKREELISELDSEVALYPTARGHGRSASTVVV